jgi:hypothetical protein
MASCAVRLETVRVLHDLLPQFAVAKLAVMVLQSVGDVGRFYLVARE